MDSKQIMRAWASCLEAAHYLKAIGLRNDAADVKRMQRRLARIHDAAMKAESAQLAVPTMPQELVPRSRVRIQNQ